MKKHYVNFFMAMMAFACVTTFASCGGDGRDGDDDDDVVVVPVTNDDNNVVGVHRIDIHFSRNAVNSEVWTCIYGLKASSSFGNIVMSNLYENGQQLPLDETTHTWSCETVRDISVRTEDGCVGVVGAVLLRAQWSSFATPEDITITCVGYANDKVVLSRVFTLPAGKKIISLSFSTSDGGGSGYVIDHEGLITE